MDITKNIKCILIQNNNSLQTEQIILNKLYEKLAEKHFEYNENIELRYITQYLEDFNVDKREHFCYSKKSGKPGINTIYLIENLDPATKNSSLVCMDKDTYDVLGVLSFKYIEWSDKDHVYDNSLYIDSFCTNQLKPMPGIGKLLLTTIIDATVELGLIDNIFLIAATKHSHGFYEKFKFKATGIVDDKMNEYKYAIDKGQVYDEAPPIQEPQNKYLNILSGGTTKRPFRVKIHQLRKLYGNYFKQPFICEASRKRLGQNTTF